MSTLPDDHYLKNDPQTAERILTAELASRKSWVAMLLSEPPENVTLAPDVEPVLPDLHKCGAGLGAECCIFLTGGSEGPTCERGGPLQFMLEQRARSGDMNARRIPAREQKWPDCMIFPGLAR